MSHTAYPRHTAVVGAGLSAELVEALSTVAAVAGLRHSVEFVKCLAVQVVRAALHQTAPMALSPQGAGAAHVQEPHQVLVPTVNALFGA